MVDDPHKNRSNVNTAGNTGRVLVKPCEHQTFAGDYFYFPNDRCYIAVNSVYYGVPHRALCDQAKLALKRYALFPGTLENVKPLFKDKSIVRTIEIDRDPFDSDFSIWYSLVDVLDFAALFKKVFKNFSRGTRKSIPKGLTAKDIHDQHLMTRFGIIPTVSDMQELITQIKTWKDKYKDQQSALLKTRRFHAPRVSLRGIFPAWSEDVIFVDKHSLGTIGCTISSTTEAFWRSTTQYHFHCPEFSGWLGRLKQLIDSFGILDPSALWDVVPFSFVVDWFFTTNQYIHSFKPRLFPAEVLIDDYSESIKVSTTVNYTLRWNTIPLNSFVETIPVPYVDSRHVGREVYETYVRSRFVPRPEHVKLGSLRVKSKRKPAVDLQRVAIAASLVGQRAPR
jgi:hypothetical protein